MSAPEARQLAERWLHYGRDDLRAARVLLAAEGIEPRLAAFQAQQAAEKAIKAVLIGAQIQFPPTHDLEALRTLLPDGSRIRAASPDLASLSVWAVRSRYPTLNDDATREDAAAEALAAEVLAFAEQDLHAGGGL